MVCEKYVDQSSYGKQLDALTKCFSKEFHQVGD